VRHVGADCDDIAIKYEGCLRAFESITIYFSNDKHRREDFCSRKHMPWLMCGKLIVTAAKNAGISGHPD
jgi:hypothetical protein